MKKLYFTIKSVANRIFLAGFILSGLCAYAQTTLAAGDIAFTAYDSTPLSGAGDSYSFVLLKNISSGTKISFTDRGYSSAGYQAVGGTESSVTWTSSTALPVGTEVYIVGLAASTYNSTTSTSTVNGTVLLTEGSSQNGLSLSNVGDQIIAFQGGNGSISGTGVTTIAGINYFYTANTTSSQWNVGSSAGPNASLMPPGLTDGTSAFYTSSVSGNTLAQSGKFNCTGTPTTTATNVRAAVLNVSNWTLSTSSVGQYSGCTFIGSTLDANDLKNTRSIITTYPNPAVDILKISGDEKIINLVVFSSEGRRISEKTMLSGERSINVSTLPQGKYLIQINTAKGNRTLAFIKK